MGEIEKSWINEGRNVTIADCFIHCEWFQEYEYDANQMLWASRSQDLNLTEQHNQNCEFERNLWKNGVPPSRIVQKTWKIYLYTY